MKATKPGGEAPHLSHAIQIANELETDSLVCDGFDYPAILEYLDPFEYACVSAIKLARKASEGKATKQPRQEGSREQKLAHLKRVSHGG